MREILCESGSGFYCLPFMPRSLSLPLSLSPSRSYFVLLCGFPLVSFLFILFVNTFTWNLGAFFISMIVVVVTFSLLLFFFCLLLSFLFVLLFLWVVPFCSSFSLFHRGIDLLHFSTFIFPTLFSLCWAENQLSAYVVVGDCSHFVWAHVWVCVYLLLCYVSVAACFVNICSGSGRHLKSFVALGRSVVAKTPCRSGAG